MFALKRGAISVVFNDIQDEAISLVQRNLLLSCRRLTKDGDDIQKEVLVVEFRPRH